MRQQPKRPDAGKPGPLTGAASPDWSALGERGSRPLRLGRRPSWIVLYAITAYFFLFVPGAASGDALDVLLMRFRQRQHEHVTFTERYSAAALDRPLESSGELFYDAPDRLEKRTLQPRPQRLVVESGTLIIEQRHKEYRVALEDYPRAAPYIDSIRATLAGDRPGLERVFLVEFSGSDEDWTLLLAPLDTRVAADVATIRIQGAADAIRIVTMKLTNGDQSVMTLGTPTNP